MSQSDAVRVVAPSFMEQAGRFVRSTYIPVLALVVAILSVLLLPVGDYALRIGTLCLVYFITVLGYNLILTVGGLFHFGFSGHFAMGAYVAAILMVDHSWGTIPSLLVVLAVSAVVTALVSFPTLRFKGDYLCIVTMAFAEILRQVILNWRSLTRGAFGISGVPPPIIFGYSRLSAGFLFAVVGGGAVLAFLIYQTMVSSRYGLAWEAIRLDEEAAEAVGFYRFPYKLALLVIGSVFAGTGGLAYSHYASIVDPTLSTVDFTIELIAIVILGGGSPLGIAIASLVLTALPQAFLEFGLYRELALAGVLIAVMNLKPEGFSLLRRRGYSRLTPGRDFSLRPLDSPQSREVEEPDEVQPIVETVGLTKRFGGLTAVDHLSVTIPEGSIFGIIGPNGAGKTTLFNLVNGMIPADDGEVRILGQEVSDWPTWRISQLGVGRTFQTIKLFSALTVLDNVVVAAAQTACAHPLSRDSWKEAVERGSAALEFVGLEDDAQKGAGALPYADQRRLEIARAIVCRPSLVLLDEPSAGMNPNELDDLRQLVEAIRRRGVTVVCIEHNMGFILPMADEVLVMNEGKRLTLGKADEISRDPVVIRAYLGRRAVGATS